MCNDANIRAWLCAPTNEVRGVFSVHDEIIKCNNVFSKYKPSASKSDRFTSLGELR